MSTSEAPPPPAAPAPVDVAGGSWKWLMLGGIVGVIGGVAAILFPVLASWATDIFVGWILIFAGVGVLIDAFSVRGAGRVILRLLLAAATIVAGLFLIFDPARGTATLTLVIAVLFFVTGGVRLVAAIQGRGTPGAGLVGVSGVLGIALGVLIILSFPSSAFWAIGLLVGVDLIFFGMTAIAAASTIMRLEKGSA
jgi:uncharacterized membrane protein HdeD (DUF308 family)